MYPAPPGRNPNRISSYPDFRNVLKIDNIQFPIAIKDISKFELLNNLSINVFTINKKEILPLALSKNNLNSPINLLMISGKNENYNDVQSFYHFAYIKNLSRLLNNQVGNVKNGKWFCERCLNHFKSSSLLKRHQVDCKTLNYSKIILPDDSNNILSFKNIKNGITVPFVIYADIECILVDCAAGNTSTDKTKAIQKHVPCSIAYYLKCSYDDSLSKFNMHTDKDCQTWFVNELLKMAHDIDSIF